MPDFYRRIHTRNIKHWVKSIKRHLQLYTPQEVHDILDSDGTIQCPDEFLEFLKKTLWLLEDFWRKEFKKIWKNYTEVKAILYENKTESYEWKPIISKEGPVYLAEPSWKAIYLPVWFMTHTIHERLWFSWDMAQAYIIAHEVAHHVQYLTWRLHLLTALHKRYPHILSNELRSKIIEHHADLLSGAFVKYLSKEHLLDKWDISELITAGHNVGDDILRRREDHFSQTHGSGIERAQYIMNGFMKDELSADDIFWDQLILSLLPRTLHSIYMSSILQLS